MKWAWLIVALFAAQIAGAGSGMGMLWPAGLCAIAGYAIARYGDYRAMEVLGVAKRVIREEFRQ